jgi:hypothetical protein
MSPYWGIAVFTQIILAVVLGMVLPTLFAGLLLMMSAAMPSAEQAEEYRKTITGSLKKWITRTIGFFLAVFALADGVIVAAPYIWAGYVRLLVWLGVQVTYTFIAVFVVGIGFGAFKFKEAQKKWYGVMEVVFSFVSVVVALMTTKPDNRVGLVITIIGAMYISSRGFGNWLGKEGTNPVSPTPSIVPQASSNLPVHK